MPCFHSGPRQIKYVVFVNSRVLFLDHDLKKLVPFLSFEIIQNVMSETNIE